MYNLMMLRKFLIFLVKVFFFLFSLRYNNESEPALKNISFQIEHRAKVGIVGRTGSG